MDFSRFLILFLSSYISLFSVDKTISYEELALIIESGETYTLLDVRTEGEFHSGHIPTAKVIPYDVLPQRQTLRHNLSDSEKRRRYKY